MRILHVILPPIKYNQNVSVKPLCPVQKSRKVPLVNGPALGATYSISLFYCVGLGTPHFGHVLASDETFSPHSLQDFKAMFSLYQTQKNNCQNLLH